MKLIPTTDHRVTSKPWQKRIHSIAEKRFRDRSEAGTEGQWPGRQRDGRYQRCEMRPLPQDQKPVIPTRMWVIPAFIYVQISQLVTKVLIRQRFRCPASGRALTNLET
jgi:hypothetical protein